MNLMTKKQLEDLRFSPDLFNNVKICQVQIRLIILNIFCITIYRHGGHFAQVV